MQNTTLLEKFLFSINQTKKSIENTLNKKNEQNSLCRPGQIIWIIGYKDMYMWRGKGSIGWNWLN